MNYLNKYIKRYYKFILIAISCLIIEVTADLMQPTLMATIVDDGIAKGELDYVFKIGGGMILIALFGAVAATLRNFVATRVAQSFGADIRGDLFRKIQGLDIKALDKFERASLITRLTNDVVNIQNFIYGIMRFFVRAPLLAIGSIVMAVRMDAKLSIIMLIIVPLIGVIIYFSIRFGYPLFLKVQGYLDKLNISLREYLKGVRVVKAFNTFKYEEERFEEKNEDLSKATIKTNRVMAVFNPLISLLVNFSVIAILLIGGLRINNGTIEVGKIIAFTNYMTQLLFALMAINHIFQSLVRARASAERIGEVFNVETTILDLGNEELDEDFENVLEFKQVNFSYTDNLEEPILKNVSFKVRKGELYGIIGSTGSGKTTLANLILRFYDINSGEVFIKGKNIRNISLDKLRKFVAIVPQKTLLFSGSILENVRWGRKDATLEEVKEVCQIANASEFIERLENSYDENVAQLGVNLSGGQKQRLSIARALVRKPEILILDDSTSALDNKTEHSIKEALKKYLGSVTTILIAQKITSIIDADKIMVLDEGEVVAIGSHNELIENCKVYKDIYRSQFGEEKGGAVNG